MKIAVIVLTYNRSEALVPVLKSLAAQCLPDDQLVIADDGSRPEHIAPIVERHWGFACKAQHAWHPDVGFTAASARNMGVLQSTAPYIVFLDGDCIPGPDFLDQHRRLARSGCFVNGSRVLLSPELTRKAIQGDWSPMHHTFRAWLRLRTQGQVNKLSHLGRWPAAWRMARSAFSWKGIRSCNMAVWRDDFLSIGGFDETFNGWGHEDADLVLRLNQRGVLRINGFMATEVFHLWHQDNPRKNEEINRALVWDRVTSGQIRATRGIESPRPESLKITELA